MAAIKWILGCFLVLLSTGCATNPIHTLDGGLKKSTSPEIKIAEKLPEAPLAKPHPAPLIPGYCRVIHTPGLSPNLFTPCNRASLILAYKKGTRPVVSIITTREDGHFDVQLPEHGPWSLTSSLNEWQVDIEFVSADQQPELNVFLKPKKKSELKKNRVTK